MRVVISEFMSLDGVVQAPGGATEDVSGGFQHGGWSMKYFDPDVMGAVIEGFTEHNEVLLQGRRTYQVSAEAWPDRAGGFADWINAAQKYVVSDTLTDDDVAAWTRPRSSASPTLSSRLPRCAPSPAATSTCTEASLSPVRSLPRISWTSSC